LLCESRQGGYRAWPHHTLRDKKSECIRRPSGRQFDQNPRNGGFQPRFGRFLNERTIVTVIEENLARLRAMRWRGKSFEVVTLPMPARIDREDLRLPASYANFYIANDCVLLPTFNDPNDSIAEATLAELFPRRRILAIDCTELIWGLGAFHCLTQQQPAV
jgi:agmatine deiminase